MNRTRAVWWIVFCVVAVAAVFLMRTIRQSASELHAFDGLTDSDYQQWVDRELTEGRLSLGQAKELVTARLALSSFANEFLDLKDGKDEAFALTLLRKRSLNDYVMLGQMTETATARFRYEAIESIVLCTGRLAREASTVEQEQKWLASFTEGMRDVKIYEESWRAETKKMHERLELEAARSRQSK